MDSIAEAYATGYTQGYTEGFDSTRWIMDVRKLFPSTDAEEPNRIPFMSYDTIVEKFGTVVASTEDDGYQGSSYYVLKDESDGRYGYLTFGWGSCSGCDALQGCHSYDELQELVDSLGASVRWFPTKNALKAWAKDFDWGGEWCANEAACKEIQEKIMDLR